MQSFFRKPFTIFQDNKRCPESLHRSRSCRSSELLPRLNELKWFRRAEPPRRPRGRQGVWKRRPRKCVGTHAWRLGSWKKWNQHGQMGNGFKEQSLHILLSGGLTTVAPFAPLPTATLFSRARPNRQPCKSLRSRFPRSHVAGMYWPPGGVLGGCAWKKQHQVRIGDINYRSFHNIWRISFSTFGNNCFCHSI